MSQILEQRPLIQLTQAEAQAAVMQQRNGVFAPGSGDVVSSADADGRLADGRSFSVAPAQIILDENDRVLGYVPQGGAPTAPQATPGPARGDLITAVPTPAVPAASPAAAPGALSPAVFGEAMLRLFGQLMAAPAPAGAALPVTEGMSLGVPSATPVAEPRPQEAATLQPTLRTTAPAKPAAAEDDFVRILLMQAGGGVELRVLQVIETPEDGDSQQLPLLVLVRTLEAAAPLKFAINSPETHYEFVLPGGRRVNCCYDGIQFILDNLQFIVLRRLPA